MAHKLLCKLYYYSRNKPARNGIALRGKDAFTSNCEAVVSGIQIVPAKSSESGEINDTLKRFLCN